MQTLHLIRHTKPDIAPGICYGQLDIGVANSFEEEAQHVLHWLPPVELILASPLLRARRLAEHLARGKRCELRSDARLMEKHFGAWEGRAWADIERSEIDAWAADILGYIPPGGESAQQLTRRVQDSLRDIAHLPQRHIAVVAHSGSIRALLAVIADIRLENTLDWEIGYGTVAGVRFCRGRAEST